MTNTNTQKGRPALDELKQMRRWVCWKAVQKKGRISKLPVAQDGSESGSDEAHSHTWVKYDEAKRGQEKNGFDGVGFIIPDGYFFLDIDHRGKTDPLTVELMDNFKSYAEVSPSGNGVHIFGRCTPSLSAYVKGNEYKEKYKMKPAGGLEFYFGGATNRFATFTENSINDMGIQLCADTLIFSVLDKYFRKDNGQGTDAAAPAEITSNPDDDWAVIAALRTQKNGDKFRRLFDDGDVSGYQSNSEADLGLCEMIAFRMGNDPEGIERIFRQSALMREKWERADYREDTIQKAIKLCNGLFHWSKMSAPPAFISESGKLIPPQLAKFFRENYRYVFVRDDARQSTLVYVYNNGVYSLYVRDMLLGLMKEPVERYNENLVAMAKINEAVNQIMSDLVYTRTADLNADERIINFENGLLNINTLQLSEHTPDLLSTIQIPCRWTGQGNETPVFDHYLDKLVDGDKQVTQLLLEFIGAVISNVKGPRMKKSLFMVGPGDTGKSQLKNLVEKILGNGNYASLDLSEMEARFGLSDVYGTRLAGSSDMGYMTVAELKTFKKLTGGDSVRVEFKGLNGFSGSFDGLLWFCMNQLPRFGGDDGKWVYDRIMVVTCPNVIPLDQQDHTLLDKMYAEREGIVYKAVMALRSVIERGYRFTEPSSVLEARQEYIRENNSVVAFYEDCLCPAKGRKDQMLVGQLHSAYKNWCGENGYTRPKELKDFKTALAERMGITVKDLIDRANSKGSVVMGVTMTDEARARCPVL